METGDRINEFKYKVAAFYDFLSIKDQDILLIKEELTNLATNQEIKGTILLACEGVNGTVCGTENSITLLFLIEQYCLGISEFKRDPNPAEGNIVTNGLINSI